MLKDDQDLVLRIVRTLGSSTVALFGIYYANGNEQLKFAGTGTLAVAGKHHGILTAAHVWDVLKPVAKVGITRVDKINHKYTIDVNAIIPTSLNAPLVWDERGPDLVFLRVPTEQVSEIEASQVFENLLKPPKMLGADSIECWMAMGTPEKLGAFTNTTASVQIIGTLVNPKYLPGAIDYYDFGLDTEGSGVPESYERFSGGGLWRVPVFSSPVTGKVDWEYRLKGVMFWQFPPARGRCVIRCQGHESIDSLVGLLENK